MILDCAARRFQAQKINLKATAAMKWINKRNSILQGQKPRNVHIPLLRQADQTLRNVRKSTKRTAAALPNNQEVKELKLEFFFAVEDNEKKKEMRKEKRGMKITWIIVD